MPPEVWAIIVVPLVSASVGYIVSIITSAAARKRTEEKHDADRKALEDKLEALRVELTAQRVASDVHQQELQDQQSKYIFDQWKSQNETSTNVRIELAVAQGSIKSLQDQLQEARAHSAERDRLLGILQEKDEQKARLIEQLTQDVATKSSLQADLQRQLSEAVEKLQQTTKERDDIQNQLGELLPLKDEQTRQAQQIAELLERQAARHEQINEWQAEMMEKTAELAQANTRIAELETENAKLKADLATATADLATATEALAKATQGMDKAVQGMGEATQTMNINNAALATEQKPENQP